MILHVHSLLQHCQLSREYFEFVLLHVLSFVQIARLAGKFQPLITFASGSGTQSQQLQPKGIFSWFMYIPRVK